MVFFIFKKSFFSAKTNLEKSSKCFKVQKYPANLRNSRKISRDRLGYEESK
jgi:hypothetical protein